MARFFGTPDGVHAGQFFIDRRELHDAFVHRPLQAGISGTAAEGADSIVVSGGYVDDQDHGAYLIYTGHGGNDPNTRRQIADQTPDASGNAGLITSRVRGLPVRVIRGRHTGSPFAPPNGYIYSGLYSVTSWWTKKGIDGFQVVQFRLDAIEEQTAVEPAPRVELDPSFRNVTVSRRIRDTAMSRAIKELYGYSCQVCGTQVGAFEGRVYAEGAHVRPLGRPHLGRDDRNNLLCLCPNHHTQLDIGGMYISNDMVAIDANTNDPIEQLRWRRDHRVDSANVEYHRSLWRVR
ncbi:YDG/SRA domain-containing protein [Agromyces sp. NPDC056965]|uniref:YDG/SRA domain-containing protein n=1 Tax=Agromyces sp. NPDC056965 TaxID=3345983 RepID=UPI003633192B